MRKKKILKYNVEIKKNIEMNFLKNFEHAVTNLKRKNQSDSNEF